MAHAQSYQSKISAEFRIRHEHVIERHSAFRRLTLDQFHAQCMIVNAVNMGDVRMVQGSEQLGMQSRMQ
jgi:hypothetical protein